MSPNASAPALGATPPTTSTAKLALLIVACAVLAAAPFILYPVFLMNALLFMLFACAFNLMLGFGGLLSFGHAAFFGMAAYIAGHSAKVWGLPFEVSVLLGTAGGAALGLVFGLLAIRRQGIYFAMITLALSQMVYFFALQAPFTHGEDGIQSIPRGLLFGLIDLENDRVLYAVIAIIAVGGMLIIDRVVHSPFGQVLKAIRDNEPRATSLGYDIDRHKLIAFVLSAALSGMAGATKVFVFRIATLSDITWHLSGEVVLMALLGGVATVWGPALGALIVIVMQHYLASFGAWVTIIQGITFMACVLLFREGVAGVFIKVVNRVRGAS
ncbi:branched-chain amino acid ABC transporter permease [uncultured Roseibium sp.]|uniref:branched-chain amino acid ABC transporter permease n=1 Tax=uncultured Roseibium sp. TaxID=1936171 RepID=UPI0032180222